MAIPNFKVLLTDEATAFIRSLPEKAQRKITYNILRVEGGEMDKNLFKSSITTFGSYAHYSMVYATVF